MSRKAKEGQGRPRKAREGMGLKVVPDSIARPNGTLPATRTIPRNARNIGGGRQDVRLARCKILYNYFTLVCGARGGVEGVGPLRSCNWSAVADQSRRRRAPARPKW